MSLMCHCGKQMSTLAKITWAAVAFAAVGCEVTTRDLGGPVIVVQHGTLGVRFTDDPDALPEITEVLPGSPAEVAELQPGDILTGFNEVEVTTAGECQELIKTTKPGDVVRLSFTRDGQEMATEVKLKKYSDYIDIREESRKRKAAERAGD